MDRSTHTRVEEEVEHIIEPENTQLQLRDEGRTTDGKITNCVNVNKVFPRFGETGL